MSFILLCLGLGFASTILYSVFGEKSQASGVIYIASMVGFLCCFALRFINMGWKGWWALTAFLPILNLLMFATGLVAPPNFKDSKKLDTFGIVVLSLLILTVAAILGLLIFGEGWLSVSGTQAI